MNPEKHVLVIPQSIVGTSPKHSFFEKRGFELSDSSSGSQCCTVPYTGCGCGDDGGDDD